MVPRWIVTEYVEERTLKDYDYWNDRQLYEFWLKLFDAFKYINSREIDNVIQHNENTLYPVILDFENAKSHTDFMPSNEMGRLFEELKSVLKAIGTLQWWGIDLRHIAKFKSRFMRNSNIHV